MNMSATKSMSNLEQFITGFLFGLPSTASAMFTAMPEKNRPEAVLFQASPHSQFGRSKCFWMGPLEMLLDLMKDLLKHLCAPLGQNYSSDNKFEICINSLFHDAAERPKDRALFD